MFVDIKRKEKNKVSMVHKDMCMIPPLNISPLNVIRVIIREPDTCVIIWINSTKKIPQMKSSLFYLQIPMPREIDHLLSSTYTFWVMLPDEKELNQWKYIFVIQIHKKKIVSLLNDLL